MSKWFETIDDLDAGAQAICDRRYGAIEVCEGALVGVHLRPWPKIISLASVVLGNWYHKHVRGDRGWLYYNQPRQFPNFLALTWAVSSRDTTWATVHAALQAMDEIARIKRVDALLCDAAAFRLSPRLLARAGWQPHAPRRWHRNYIKRFYGEYQRPRLRVVGTEMLAAAGRVRSQFSSRNRSR